MMQLETIKPLCIQTEDNVTRKYKNPMFTTYQ